MEDKPGNTVLIAGCGAIGRRVAALLQAPGHLLTALVQSVASAVQLQTTGVAVWRMDLDAVSRDARRVDGFNEIYYFVPPPPQGEQDPRFRRFLQMLDEKSPPRRIVTISTSAVYGDCHGKWITEAQPVNPSTARGHRRLDAERQLQAWAAHAGTEWIILRVAGIYGPGKLPLARLKKGTPVLREADSPYTNRIHVDDLAAVCVAAMTSEHANTIYNISDGHPGNMTDYFFSIADAAGLPRPPMVTREAAPQVLSPGMLSFLQDSRRIDNRKMLRELGVELKYPDLASGLLSCFQQKT